MTSICSYGHRQDAKGYAKALEEFDAKLPEIQNCIGDSDVLILTADHGNDPTDQSTDHTREYVPLLCYTKSGKKNVNLGVRHSFADVGKTVAEFFNSRKCSIAFWSKFPEQTFYKAEDRSANGNNISFAESNKEVNHDPWKSHWHDLGDTER